MKGNALNQTLDKFRSVVKFGGTPLSGDNFTDVSDAAQKAGETLSVRDISGGSRNLDPERKAIFKDLFDKLQKDDPEAAKAFMLSYMGYTHQEIIDMDDATPRSQAAVSRGVNKASEFLGDLYKGNLEEGEDLPTGEETPGDRNFNDAEAIRADEKQFFEDFYKWAYDNYGSMVEDGELDDELLAVYRKVLAKSEDPDAELMEPDIDLDYELPKRGSMAGSSTNPTPPTARRRGSMFPRRPDERYRKNEELSLEETIAAVVKETLGL